MRVHCPHQGIKMSAAHSFALYRVLSHRYCSLKYVFICLLCLTNSPPSAHPPPEKASGTMRVDGLNRWVLYERKRTGLVPWFLSPNRKILLLRIPVLKETKVMPICISIFSIYLRACEPINKRIYAMVEFFCRPHGRISDGIQNPVFFYPAFNALCGIHLSRMF